jgi:hypothetical protein
MAKAAPEPEIPIPEIVTQSRVMKRKKITKRGLPKLTIDMMTAWGPEMVGLWFTEKYKSAKRGDKDALDDIAEVYGLIQKRGGPPASMVNVNLGGQMAIESGVGRGYDSFMRQLYETRQRAVRPADSQKALPAPEAA